MRDNHSEAVVVPLRAQHQPFRFLLIETRGNHRPAHASAANRRMQRGIYSCGLDGDVNSLSIGLFMHFQSRVNFQGVKYCGCAICLAPLPALGNGVNGKYSCRARNHR